MPKRRYYPKRQKGSKYRSGLERKIASGLKSKGVEFTYESMKLEYVKSSKYIPDFVLSNGVIIEAKGYFTSSDRSKMKLIKKQHPDLDIRFVFSNPKTKLNKSSKTSYADWCDRHGFLWAAKDVPQSWLDE